MNNYYTAILDVMDLEKRFILSDDTLLFSASEAFHSSIKSSLLQYCEECNISLSGSRIPALLLNSCIEIRVNETMVYSGLFLHLLNHFPYPVLHMPGHLLLKYNEGDIIKVNLLSPIGRIVPAMTEDLRTDEQSLEDLKDFLKNV
jgi:hypothetical protein